MNSTTPFCAQRAALGAVLSDNMGRRSQAWSLVVGHRAPDFLLSATRVARGFDKQSLQMSDHGSRGTSCGLQ